MLYNREILAERNWRHYKNTVYAEADADHIMSVLIERHGGFYGLMEELCVSQLNEEKLQVAGNQTVGEFLKTLEQMETNFGESGPFFMAVSGVEQLVKKLLERFTEKGVQKPKDMDDQTFTNTIANIRDQIVKVQAPFQKLKDTKIWGKPAEKPPGFWSKIRGKAEDIGKLVNGAKETYKNFKTWFGSDETKKLLGKLKVNFEEAMSAISGVLDLIGKLDPTGITGMISKGAGFLGGLGQNVINKFSGDSPEEAIESIATSVNDLGVSDESLKMKPFLDLLKVDDEYREMLDDNIVARFLKYYKKWLKGRALDMPMSQIDADEQLEDYVKKEEGDGIHTITGAEGPF